MTMAPDGSIGLAAYEVSRDAISRKDQDAWERSFHFTGITPYDELPPYEKGRYAQQFMRFIDATPQVREAFAAYKHLPGTSTHTFATRISGITRVIANSIKQQPFFDRRIRDVAPMHNRFSSYDPFFGENVDAMIGPTRSNACYPFETDFHKKKRIRIADFGCSPKRGGSPTLLFLKKTLCSIFPDKEISCVGYDIDFLQRYPHFDRKGKWQGWEKGYAPDSDGCCVVNGIEYRDATWPRHNIVPMLYGTKIIHTFVPADEPFDFVLNTMFYSVAQISGASQQTLAHMRKAQHDSLHPGGILFLNTCDDCYHIYPAACDTPLNTTIPFISTLQNITQKTSDLIDGSSYCAQIDLEGVPIEKAKQRIYQAIFRAYRLGDSRLSFLDRIFDIYRLSLTGMTLSRTISHLEDPDLCIIESRKEENMSYVQMIRASSLKQ